MKKISTIAAAGLGLAAIALGAFAIPAGATTNVDSSASTPSASTQSTRLEGKPLLFGGGYKDYYQSTTEGENVKLLENRSTAAVINTPAVGDTGEVYLDGLCLTRTDVQTPPWPTQYDVTVEECNGHRYQQWTMHADGGLSGEMMNDTYWVTQNNEPGYRKVVAMTSGNGHISFDVSTMDPVTVVAAPVDISGPAQNEITLRNPTFTGTGDEGAEIVVTDANGVELCRATVTGGNWSCTTGIDLPDGPLDATATQTATDGTTSTDTVTIIVADPLNTPVIDPVLAGGASMTLLAAAGAIFAIRRKQNATAAL